MIQGHRKKAVGANLTCSTKLAGHLPIISGVPEQERNRSKGGPERQSSRPEVLDRHTLHLEQQPAHTHVRNRDHQPAANPEIFCDPAPWVLSLRDKVREMA